MLIYLVERGNDPAEIVEGILASALNPYSLVDGEPQSNAANFPKEPQESFQTVP